MIVVVIAEQAWHRAAAAHKVAYMTALHVPLQVGLPGSVLSRPCQRSVVAKANNGDGKRVDWDREWNR